MVTKKSNILNKPAAFSCAFLFKYTRPFSYHQALKGSNGFKSINLNGKLKLVKEVHLHLKKKAQWLTQWLNACFGIMIKYYDHLNILQSGFIRKTTTELLFSKKNPKTSIYNNVNVYSISLVTNSIMYTV